MLSQLQTCLAGQLRLSVLLLLQGCTRIERSGGTSVPAMAELASTESTLEAGVTLEASTITES